MTVLALTKLFINRVDTGEAVSAQTDDDRQQEWSTAREIVTYASGRQRAHSVAGERGSIPYVLVEVPLATVTTLRQWATDGILVQVRDHRSQKWFGVFSELAVKETKDVNVYAVGITVKTLTYTEGV